MAEVTLSGVNVHYGAAQALFDVSLGINDGDFVVFVGPSGCGKSTLLRSIAGLEAVSSGRIRIGGEDMTDAAPSDRNVAMVFQSYALYPHMTVRENMEFGLKVNGVAPNVRAERIREAGRILQLGEFLERRPAQLSGGQRQRVAIGRAIVRQPKVFLFDEPLSNLDAKLRIQMRVELEGLHQELQATMIYVTHDQVEAMTMADRIVVLNNGRVEQTGAPLDIYHRPQTEFVAGFIGAPSMNFLEVAPDGDCVSYHGSPLGAAGSKGAAARIGIRPEHISVGGAGTSDLDATVRVAELLGGESYIHARTGAGDEIIARIEGETALRPGEAVGLRFAPDRVHFFDGDGRRIAD